jgi:hypothetical protein
MNFTNEQLIGIGIVGLLALWYLKNQATEKLNPFDQNNAVNTAFNDWYAGGPDGEGTLGTDVADINYEYSPYVLADKARESIGDWWDSMFAGVDG